MNRRSFTAAAFATPLMSGCLWDKHFDLSWDEEIQLHDGRVIVVKVTHTYERLRREIGRYTSALPRDTEFSFDAGAPVGRVTQLFKGFHPMFLGWHEGTWYAVLYGDYYYRSRELPGQDWGELEGPYGQWAIRLDNGKWQPMSMSRLPAAFYEPNMMLLKGAVSEQAEFDGKKVTLQDKQAWVAKHPYDYADIRLTRPTAVSPRRKDSIPSTSIGDTK